MITLFRRFRERLLSTQFSEASAKAGDKFSKYLIYVNGKVIPMVISSLNAFQISSLKQKPIKS
ncbi:hypothetical protein [Psychroserpens sp. Hel_I_66]|uniref:hypothetical protein n=1 Tax=Psychroserpens sp. Hel_I_66 TaxID=1250004 RepID=UPI000647339E|nr:hypothetical protein [Psychroserpens sp. Hel_I_66]